MNKLTIKSIERIWKINLSLSLRSMFVRRYFGPWSKYIEMIAGVGYVGDVLLKPVFVHDVDGFGVGGMHPCCIGCDSWHKGDSLLLIGCWCVGLSGWVVVPAYCTRWKCSPPIGRVAEGQAWTLGNSAHSPCPPLLPPPLPILHHHHQRCPRLLDERPQ